MYIYLEYANTLFNQSFRTFRFLVTVKGRATLKYASKHFLFGNPLNRSLRSAQAHIHGNDETIASGVAQIECE